MSQNCIHLYLISFTVGSESGLAMVAAYSESGAIDVLRSSGSRSCVPGSYTVLQSRDIGMTSSCHFGLLLEVYVNAEQVYDAVIEALDKVTITGGGSGKDGKDGKDGKSAYDLWLEAGHSGTVADFLNALIGPQGPAGADGATGAIGPVGPTGPVGPGVPAGGSAGQVLAKISGTDYDTQWVNPSGGGASTTVEDNLNSTSTTNALSANQGRILKEMITNSQINYRKVTASEYETMYQAGTLQSNILYIVVDDSNGQLT